MNRLSRLGILVVLIVGSPMAMQVSADILWAPWQGTLDNIHFSDQPAEIAPQSDPWEKVAGTLPSVVVDTVLLIPNAVHWSVHHLMYQPRPDAEKFLKASKDFEEYVKALVHKYADPMPVAS